MSNSKDVIKEIRHSRQKTDWIQVRDKHYKCKNSSLSDNNKQNKLHKLNK